MGQYAFNIFIYTILPHPPRPMRTYRGGALLFRYMSVSKSVTVYL